jgi:hypothetical protein
VFIEWFAYILVTKYIKVYRVAWGGEGLHMLHTFIKKRRKGGRAQPIHEINETSKVI